MQRKFKGIFSPLAFALLSVVYLASCHVVKNLPQDKSLLLRNKIVVQSQSKPIVREKLHDDMLKIASQKPNTRLFGFMPARMWLYYTASHKKKLTKFRQWLIDKVGEPPVIYDSTFTDKSLDLMETYLQNSGFIHATITDTVITKNKRTRVTYVANTREEWTIGQIELPKGHNVCDSIVRDSRKNSFLKKGDRFDITNLKSERERIENVLRNNGFAFFNREYVTYITDTISQDKTVNIAVIINPPSDTSQHRQYRMNKIVVITDFAPDALNDTIKRDTITEGEYTLLAQKMKFRKKVLLRAIFFKKNKLFSREDEVRTTNHFLQLGFKYINIEYKIDTTLPGNYLNCVIELSPAKRHVFGYNYDLDVNDEGLFGAAASFTYTNKNVSKAGDQLDVNVSAGVQVRFTKPSGEREQVQLMDINVSAGVTYYLNKFVIPGKHTRFANVVNPRTRISVNYTFEHRYDFDLNGNVVFLYQLDNFSASYGYEWYKLSTSHNDHHLFNPITVDFYLLPKQGPDFIARLDSNPLLKSSFEDQVIIGPSYTYWYTNQKTNDDRTSMNFRLNLEMAGNVLEAAYKLASLNDQHDSLYLIGNKPFSEYVRMEADWVNRIRINHHSAFYIRTDAGIGVAFGNSEEMPFIKQFYVGGPNSLRGFLIREIGPGSYYDPTLFDPETGTKTGTATGLFDQTGDLKLETNAEVRFDIYKWLKGAFFVDAGNVWTLRPGVLPGANFDITRFWSEFAVDAGPGIRLDFNFFVVRFDYGFPLRDPRRDIGERWQFADGVAFKNGQLQLAIGYPF